MTLSLASIWGTISGMGLAGLRSFLRTMLLLFCVGAILGVVTYHWLTGGFGSAVNRGPVLAATLAVAVLIECVVVGIVLAGKRAGAMALIHGLRAHRLGEATVRWLFQRLLGITADQPHGQRGGTAAQVAERIPLAQLENRLSTAIRDALGEEAAGGSLPTWLRRRLQRRLLGMVQKYTMARFREADSEYGGVDLAAVRAEIESSIDNRLIQSLKHGVNVWTAVALVFLIAQVYFGNCLLAGFLK